MLKCSELDRVKFSACDQQHNEKDRKLQIFCLTSSFHKSFGNYKMTICSMEYRMVGSYLSLVTDSYEKVKVLFP